MTESWSTVWDPGPQKLNANMARWTRKVDTRLPAKGNSNSYGARPVHQIISMTKWIRSSSLTMKNSLSGSLASLEFTRSNCKTQWLQCTTSQVVLIHFWRQFPQESVKLTFAIAPRQIWGSRWRGLNREVGGEARVAGTSGATPRPTPCLRSVPPVWHNLFDFGFERLGFRTLCLPSVPPLCHNLFALNERTS